jgi:hypothetical protein
MTKHFLFRIKAGSSPVVVEARRKRAIMELTGSVYDAIRKYD